MKNAYCNEIFIKEVNDHFLVSIHLSQYFLYYNILKFNRLFSNSGFLPLQIMPQTLVM